MLSKKRIFQKIEVFLKKKRKRKLNEREADSDRELVCYFFDVAHNRNYQLKQKKSLGACTLLIDER